MKNILRNKSFLEVLLSATPKLRRIIIDNATPSQKQALIEFMVNIVRGNVPLTPIQRQKLMKHKKKLRHLCNVCYNEKKNKIINKNSKKAHKAIVQTGGVLPFLIAPLAALAAKAAIGGAISAGTGYATKKIIDAASGK